MLKIKNLFLILFVTIVYLPSSWASEPIAEVLWVKVDRTVEGIQHHIMLSEMIRLARLEGFTPIASNILPNSGFSVSSYNNNIRSNVNAQNTSAISKLSVVIC